MRLLQILYLEFKIMSLIHLDRPIVFDLRSIVRNLLWETLHGQNWKQCRIKIIVQVRKNVNAAT
jgi:hypothetical protein